MAAQNKRLTLLYESLYLNHSCLLYYQYIFLASGVQYRKKNTIHRPCFFFRGPHTFQRRDTNDARLTVMGKSVIFLLQGLMYDVYVQRVIFQLCFFPVIFKVLSMYRDPLHKMVKIRLKVCKKKKKGALYTHCQYGAVHAGVFTHQLSICRRLFHWSVSGRWSCAGTDCEGGRRGHKAGCTGGHGRRGDRCRRTPLVCLTPDTELHLDRALNHTHSHPPHSPHLSSPVSTNTLDITERRYGTVEDPFGTT